MIKTKIFYKYDYISHVGIFTQAIIKRIAIIYFDDSDTRVYKLKIMKKISPNIKNEA